MASNWILFDFFEICKDANIQFCCLALNLSQLSSLKKGPKIGIHLHVTFW